MDTVGTHNQVPLVLVVVGRPDNGVRFPAFDRHNLLSCVDSLFVLQPPIEDPEKFLALEK